MAIPEHSIKGPTPSGLGTGGLDGWTLREGTLPVLPDSPWAWSDGMGTAVRRVPGEPGHLLLRSDGLASALVDLGMRSVLLQSASDDGDLARHWVTDQVAPRILSHMGHLVIHGGSVVTEDGRGILVTAPTGHGKPTLTAFLHQGRWPLLGDDAAILRPETNGVTVQAVYPRLKLRTDAWERLYPERGAERPRAGWKAIVDITRDTPFSASRPEVPLAAIFCLAPPGTADRASAVPIRAAELCMDLVRNSFALDPSDRLRASARLRLASAVAGMVPGFLLAYPRDYQQLPQVRTVIRDALGSAT